MVKRTSTARRALLAAGGAAVVGLAAFTAAPAFASASTHHYAQSRGVQPNISATCDDGTRIRKSPVNGTTLGECYHTHSVTVHCWVLGGDGYIWSNITDNTTKVRGYSRDDLLHWAGSLPHC